MNKSFSKRRHIELSNLILEERLINEKRLFTEEEQKYNPLTMEPKSKEEFITKGLCTTKDGKITIKGVNGKDYGWGDYSINKFMDELGVDATQSNELILNYCPGHVHDDGSNTNATSNTKYGVGRLPTFTNQPITNPKDIAKTLVWKPGEVIKMGSKTNDIKKVKALQSALKISRSRSAKILVTGYFGTLTDQALKNNYNDLYQTQKGLDQSLFTKILDMVQTNKTTIPSDTNQVK